jgi:hypothetical protein
MDWAQLSGQHVALEHGVPGKWQIEVGAIDLSPTWKRGGDFRLTPILWLSALLGIDVYLGDRSLHLTGCLKHWLAGSSLLYGICNGKIEKGAPVAGCSNREP